MTNFVKNQNLKEEKNKNKWYKKIKWNVKTFNIILICLIIFTGFLYLLAVNNSAIKGYEIRDLEIQLEEAKISNRNLQLQTRQMQSVKVMAEKINQIGMVAVDYVEYLKEPGGEIAVAR